MINKISILGSTGSIGQTTLKILNKKKKFKIDILAANKNYNLICKQIINFKPKYFIVSDNKTFKKLKKKFKNNKVKILDNFDDIKLLKTSNITVSAIPGIAGLKPTISMIKYSKKILIANKESVICGWNLINSLANRNRTEIVPIDSEHYSILKLIENHKKKEIKKIYITASGGCLLNYDLKKIKKIKPKDILRHPKWKMGKKITVDSSTLMNKILELIEAQKIFNISNENLDILIHPSSLIHAIVEFKNGLTKLLFHDTNMIIPITNALYNNKLNIDNFYKPKIDFDKKNLLNLNFSKVDKKIFPIIKLKNKINQYPSTGIIINAANEVIVEKFLKKKVSFLAINKAIFQIMRDRNYFKYAIKDPRSFKEILKIDKWARKKTEELSSKYENYF